VERQKRISKDHEGNRVLIKKEDVLGTGQVVSIFYGRGGSESKKRGSERGGMKWGKRLRKGMNWTFCSINRFLKDGGDQEGSEKRTL